MDNIRKVFVDSNIFIFANIKEYPEYSTAKTRIEDLIRDHKLFINAIIVSEVQYKLYRLLDEEESFTRTQKLLNSKYVEYKPVEQSTILRALELSRDFSIRINDAIIAAHAIDLNASIFTDNTKDFDKVLNLRVVPLR